MVIIEPIVESVKRKERGEWLNYDSNLIGREGEATARTEEYTTESEAVKPPSQLTPLTPYARTISQANHRHLICMHTQHINSNFG